MFTTGSKLFLGGTVLSFAGALVFGLSTGGPTGMLGTIGLVSVGVVFAFLAGINFYTRDCNVPPMDEAAVAQSAAGRGPAGRSLWPLVSAVAVAGLAVGAVSKPVVFILSVVVLIAAIVEWMVETWAKRASGDAAFNDGLRKRVLHPLEFPVLSSLVLCAVLYGFSRLMLTISKDAGRWAFILLGAIVGAAGFVIAARRGMSKTTIGGISAVGLLAILGVGVASAVSGQRTIEEHAHISAAVCLGQAPESEIEEVDHKASQSVSAKSNVIANVVLTEDNRLVAFNNGIPNVEYHEIYVPRSNVVHVLFTNRTDAARRLTVHLGTYKASDGTEGSEQADCTTAIERDGKAFLTFRIDKSQAASTTPFRLTVPEVEEQEIKVVVP